MSSGHDWVSVTTGGNWAAGQGYVPINFAVDSDGNPLTQKHTELRQYDMIIDGGLQIPQHQGSSAFWLVQREQDTIVMLPIHTMDVHLQFDLPPMSAKSDCLVYSMHITGSTGQTCPFTVMTAKLVHIQAESGFHLSTITIRSVNKPISIKKLIYRTRFV